MEYKRGGGHKEKSEKYFEGKKLSKIIGYYMVITCDGSIHYYCLGITRYPAFEFLLANPKISFEVKHVILQQHSI